MIYLVPVVSGMVAFPRPDLGSRRNCGLFPPTIRGQFADDSRTILAPVDIEQFSEMFSAEMAD
jgi:hypothetical protein